MNIRRIITEAIDEVILKKYAEGLGWCLGKSGINYAPVANDQNAVNFIVTLSDFAFQVKYAIEGDKIMPPENSNRPFTKKQKLLRPYSNKTNRGYIDQAVNWAADTANDMYGYARQAGLNGLDPIVGGVMTAMKRGYNAGRDIFAPDNFQQQDTQQVVAQDTPANDGSDLTTLMGEDYNTVLMNYQQTLQVSPGILSRVPNVGNVMKILEDIKNALRTA